MKPICPIVIVSDDIDEADDIVFTTKANLDEVLKDLSYALVLGENGSFTYKKNIVASIIQPDSKKNFAKVDEKFDFKLPNLDKESWKRMLGFFIWSYRTHSAEAMVHLFFNREDNSYIPLPPVEQIVSSGTVEYGEASRPTIAGAINVGTAHSHHTMTAFHSGVDENDQAKYDGLHITFGKITDINPEIDARVFCDGKSHKIPLEKIIPKSELPVYEFPTAWTKVVKKKEYTVSTSAYIGSESSEYYKKYLQNKYGLHSYKPASKTVTSLKMKDLSEEDQNRLSKLVDSFILGHAFKADKVFKEPALDVALSIVNKGGVYHINITRANPERSYMFPYDVLYNKTHELKQTIVTSNVLKVMAVTNYESKN